MFFMRNMSVSGIVFICFLWGVLMFAAVGHFFSKYDAAGLDLHSSRIRTALTDLRAEIQAKTDAGATLPEAETIRPAMDGYVGAASDTVAFSVFDAGSGKVLFGSKNAKAGTAVSPDLREKCKAAGRFFLTEVKDGEIVGVLLTDALEEKNGCLIAEYKTDESVRERMIRDAFRTWLRLMLIGAACLAALYFKSRLPQGGRRFGLTGAAVVLLLLLIFPCVNGMCVAFEKSLKQPISMKAKTVARVIGGVAQKAVKGGVPFAEQAGMDAYLEQIRKNNPELMFILLTDKSGRVLFENGSTQGAFETDARTGAIALKAGYFNTAEPVVVNAVPVGWVQIGINERFVREKIF